VEPSRTFVLAHDLFVEHTLNLDSQCLKLMKLEAKDGIEQPFLQRA
jgi:hypothetical protein